MIRLLTLEKRTVNFPRERKMQATLERPLKTNANSVDRLQWTLCVFATLCIAALFALDVYMGIG